MSLKKYSSFVVMAVVSVASVGVVLLAPGSLRGDLLGLEQADGVIDDTRAAPLFALQGAWTVANGGYKQKQRLGSGTQSRKATWGFAGVLTTIPYDVYVTWQKAPKLSKTATYKIIYGDNSSTTVVVDQNVQSATENLAFGVPWRKLGTFLSSNNKITVELTGGSTDAPVAADAALIKRQERKADVGISVTAETLYAFPSPDGAPLPQGMRLLRYRISVKNAGPHATADDVFSTYQSALNGEGQGVVFDNQFGEPQSADGNCSSGSCTFRQLQPGQERSVTLIGRVVGNPPCKKPLPVQYQLTINTLPRYLYTDTNPANDSRLAHIIIPCAELSVQLKAAQPTIQAGKSFTYYIDAINHGPNTTAGFFATHIPPTGLVFHPDGSDCSIANGKIICKTGGNLAPLESRRYTVKYDVPADFICGKTAPSVAMVQNIIPDTNAADNVSTLLTAATPCTAELSVQIQTPETAIQAGTVFTYYIDVANQGPNRATGFTATHIPPAGFIFRQENDDCSSINGQTICGKGWDPAVATKRFTVTYDTPPTFTCGANVQSTVMVQSTAADTNMADNTSTIVNAAAPCTELSVQLQTPEPVMQPGTVFTYYIDATNQGSAPAKDTIIVYTAPSELAFHPDGSDCSLSDGKIICGQGWDAAPLTTRRFTVKYDVPASFATRPCGLSMQSTTTISNAVQETTLADNVSTLQTPVECSCGNKRVNEWEECDDGNTIDGDGCSSTCTVQDLPMQTVVDTVETYVNSVPSNILATNDLRRLINRQRGQFHLKGITQTKPSLTIEADAVQNGQGWQLSNIVTNGELPEGLVAPELLTDDYDQFSFKYQTVMVKSTGTEGFRMTWQLNGIATGNVRPVILSKVHSQAWTGEKRILVIRGKTTTTPESAELSYPWGSKNDRFDIQLNRLKLAIFNNSNGNARVSFDVRDAVYVPPYDTSQLDCNTESIPLLKSFLATLGIDAQNYDNDGYDGIIFTAYQSMIERFRICWRQEGGPSFGSEGECPQCERVTFTPGITNDSPDSDIIMHEFTHGLGFDHDRTSATCNPMDAQQELFENCGSGPTLYTVMGRPNLNGYMHPINRAALGWLKGSQTTLITESGDYDVYSDADDRTSDPNKSLILQVAIKAYGEPKFLYVIAPNTQTVDALSFGQRNEALESMNDFTENGIEISSTGNWLQEGAGRANMGTAYAISMGMRRGDTGFDALLHSPMLPGEELPLKWEGTDVTIKLLERKGDHARVNVTYATNLGY